MIFRYYGHITFKIRDGGEVETTYSSYTTRQDMIDYMFGRYPIESYSIRPYVYMYVYDVKGPDGKFVNNKQSI